jgi:succinoglycan biosynthesis protein ExoA
MNPARVVAIMPVYNEARHLPLVLESISAQTFARDRLFFVGVDGNSTDGSGEILAAWLACGSVRGRVLRNPLRKIPISLNMGIAEATPEDIVVRLDGHTIYGDSYIAEAVAALEKAPADVACIGCAHRPIPGNSFEQRIVAALYTNPMGLGGADFRLGDDVREVDNIYLGAWRPGVLMQVGGFNEVLQANEDGDISARIRQLGYRILRVPLPCRFFVNRGVAGSIRQWGRYGFWRAKMLQRNPKFIRVRHVLAPAAAITALALTFSPLRLLLAPGFALYSYLIFRGRARDEAFPVTLATLFFFPTLQFAFAAGMLAGLASGKGTTRS